MSAGTPIERTAAAESLRHLGHALVGHEVDAEVLERIRDAAEGFLVEVESGARRSRPASDLRRRMFETPPADGEIMDHYAECVVSGQANPMGVAIRVERRGDEAVSRVSLGAAYEGAPGRAHGGIIAAIFDETMSYVLSIISTPAFTGWLKVTYRAPAPLGRDIEFRARLDRRDGRKIRIVAEANEGATLVAEAEGLFIAVPAERLGERGEP